MNSVSRSSWLAASVVVIVVLVAGGIFSGCSTAPEPEKKDSADKGGKPETPAPKPSGEPAKPKAPTEPTEPTEPAEPTEPTEPTEKPAADPPAPPEVSKFAPAGDLVGQVAEYIKRLEKTVETEEEFNDSQEKIAKDANTLIVIALALGLHDENNKHMGAAPLLVKQAQQLAAAADYASARRAVASVKGTAAGLSSPYAAELKWEKVASLEQLMKKVPAVNTKVTMYLRTQKRFKSKAESLGGLTAALAVIAQGSMANTEEAKTPDEVAKWYGFCAQMRDAAGALNAATHAGDYDAAKAANVELQQSCKDCHAIFHPEEEL